ncbi:DUF5677 domain-containing protein, partial [Sinorhizobium meliloti]|uniref:DUF5677 domain-containing protein n=1 Tax=Rhizobium meliloti TaxID=382 RepID=UPI0013E39882
MLAVYHKEWIKLTADGVKGENPFLSCFKDNPEVVEKLEHHKAELKVYTDQFTSNFDKFKAAGMENEYRSVYNSLCNDSHNNIRALTANSEGGNPPPDSEMMPPPSESIWRGCSAGVKFSSFDVTRKERDACGETGDAACPRDIEISLRTRT